MKAFLVTISVTTRVIVNAEDTELDDDVILDAAIHNFQ
jgi:hypothetical protein